MNFIPKHLRFLFTVYGWGILFFTLFRVGLFLSQWTAYTQLPDDRVSLIAKAFFMGWRFDTCISGYLLALPVLVLSVAAFFRYYNNRFHQLITWFIGLVYTLAFLMCAVDIPHYDNFYSRLNSMVFQWASHGLDFSIKMIGEESIHYVYFAVLLLICFLFFKIIFRLKRKYLDIQSAGEIKQWLLVLTTLIFIGLTFIGIRGRLDEKSPIRVGTAAFSNHALPNHLGLNPVFTMMKSMLNDQKAENKTLRFMEDDKALQLTRQYLNVPDSTGFQSPIARAFEPTGEVSNANVIIVILESMSAAKMGRYGSPHQLTPHLDSLAKQGLAFDRFYTAGTHTHNGLFSTLFGHPALMKKHSMSVVNIPQYAGIAATLKAQNYRTIHFMTHDDQFDNVGGFFSTNGYERVVSEDDYPQEQVKSTLGVPDHIMYEFSVPVLNTLHESGQPFFASYMTTSDHIPYIIPDDIPFKPKQGAKDLAIVEYVDWSIEHFLDLCRAESWFDNTLFVFLADHGRPINSTYDIALNYHHSPLIFYSPTLLPEAKTQDNFALQMDVFPTIMGILNRPFVNNTFGVNLLDTERPFAYFSADDKYGCLNDDYFLIVRQEGEPSLYQYQNRDTKNYLKEQEELGGEMKQYTEAMLHTSQWLVLNGLTGMDGD